MRLTIIPSDSSVYMDGSGYLNIDLSWIPDINGKKVHAVQWMDGEGEIEFVDTSPNMKINELGIFERAIDLWNEKKSEEEAFKQQQLELEERRKREEEERLRSQFITFDEFDEEYGLNIDEFTELDEKPYIPPTPTHIPPVEPPLSYSDSNEDDEDEDLFYDIEELLKEI